MKRLFPHALAALLAAASLPGVAAQPSDPSAEAGQAVSSAGAITPDADEMAAIRRARERCREAGGPEAQQGCMNQAQIEYYRQRDGAMPGRDGMPPSESSAPVLPRPESLPAMPSEPKAQ